MALKATLTPHKPIKNYGESGKIHFWLIVLFKMSEEFEYEWNKLQKLGLL